MLDITLYVCAACAALCLGYSLYSLVSAGRTLEALKNTMEASEEIHAYARETASGCPNCACAASCSQRVEHATAEVGEGE